MSSMLNDTLNNAKNFTETAKDGAQTAASSARSTILDGVHAFTGLVSMLRGLGVDDALGWVGLARRKSPFAMFAMFGAGVAVGTGVGMLIAPKSGAELRRAICSAFRGLEQYEQKAEDIAGKAVGTVKETAQDLIGKAKDVAKDIEGKVENMDGAKADTKSTYGSMDRAGDGGRSNKTTGQHRVS